MIDIYGIPNCGSVKKALQWARENGVDFVFHNFKTEAPSVELIDKWMDEIGAARLLNRSSQTWKSLDPSVRTAAAENPAAIKQLLATSPLLIKRPVIVWADGQASTCRPVRPAAFFSTHCCYGLLGELLHHRSAHA